MDWFANILFRIFASVFTNDIGLYFCYFVLSLSGFVITFTLDSGRGSFSIFMYNFGGEFVPFLSSLG